MIFITADENIDFNEQGYVMKTLKYPGLPSKRTSKANVIGRDGNFTFADGFNNKLIRVTLTAIDAADISVRRANARYFESVLAKPGKLILDYEADIFYVANIYKGAEVQFNASYDTISIEFDCDTFALSAINDQITWDEADTAWNDMFLPWEGDPQDFVVSPLDVITIFNRGNHEALPIIKVTGVGDITLTHENGSSLTYTGLNGIINIDTRNLIVYDDSMQNAIAGFDGNFFGLAVGNNDITITGSFTTINLFFENKDYFL